MVHVFGLISVIVMFSTPVLFFIVGWMTRSFDLRYWVWDKWLQQMKIAGSLNQQHTQEYYDGMNKIIADVWAWNEKTVWSRHVLRALKKMFTGEYIRKNNEVGEMIRLAVALKKEGETNGKNS
jgi:hypothetical protein